MLKPHLLLDLTVRITVAISLGAAIGLERQWRLRTAGIRTNALVSAGSALFVLLGVVPFGGAGQTDPTRVAAQVVSGIGFLGAGVILRDGANIRGVTTAATLWCAAAVGSLCGAGLESLAFVGGGAIIATNTLLRPLSRFINSRTRDRSSNSSPEESSAAAIDYVLEVVTSDKSEQRIRGLVLQAVSLPEYTLTSLDVRPGKDSQMRLVAALSASQGGGTSGLEMAVHRLSLDPKVTSTRWWVAESED